MKFSFGKNFKKLRMRANLTQLEVAKALQISRQSISKWEMKRGFPSILMLPEIIIVLKCTYEELFAQY